MGKLQIVFLYTFNILFFLSVIYGSFAQEFPYSKEVKELSNPTKIELVKMCQSFVGMQEFNFNFNTADLRNDKKVDSDNKVKTPEKTQEELIKSLKGDYSDAQINFDIADSYLKMNDETNFNEYINKSIDNCETAIKMYPDSVVYYHIYGQILSLFNKTDELEELYKLGVSNNPKDDLCRPLLAITLMNHGKFDEAKKTCKEGIEVNPEQEINYFYLILAEVFELFNNSNSENLLKTKSTEDLFSIKLFEEASKKYPENKIIELTYNMTRQYLLFLKIMGTGSDIQELNKSLSASDKKEINNLFIYYKKTLKNKKVKNKYTLYYAMGALKMLQGDYNKCIEYNKKAIEDRRLYETGNLSSMNDIYNNLASVYAIKQDTISCINLLNEKNSKLGDNIKDYNLLIAIYLSSGKFTKVEQTIDKLIEKNLYDDNTLQAYCLYNIISGTYNVSEDLLVQLFDYNKNDYENYIISGILNFCKGDDEQTYTMLNKAYELKPDDEILVQVCDIILNKN